MMNSEERNKRMGAEDENIFSTRVKAGRRVYFLDVKSTMNGGNYLAITETRKKPNGDAKSMPYIRQTIFIYPEDFDKFEDAMRVSMLKIKELNEAAGIVVPVREGDITRTEVTTEEVYLDDETAKFTLSESDLGFDDEK